MGGGGGGPALTPKAISKSIKAKGLLRLRWYCQMCTKQCRDENGFQNHCRSPGHVRALAAFAEDPDTHVADFSARFTDAFLGELRRRAGAGVAVPANAVYQDVIRERHHVHMNATRWATLAEFVAALGVTGRGHAGGWDLPASVPTAGRHHLVAVWPA